MTTVKKLNLLSDQVDETEVVIITRELEKTLASKIIGEVVEFGCYIGTTSVYLAGLLKNTDKKLYLYDSFEGLPKKSKEDASPAGTTFIEGELLATRSDLIKNFKRANLKMPIIKKAWFHDLKNKDLPNNICFAFLDGDFYDSIMDSLKLIWPKLTRGSTVIIDDYMNEQLPGVAKAIDLWQKAHPFKLQVEHSLAIIKLD